MTIAVIVDGFPRLSETFILRHITGLLERGHAVTVFAMPTQPSAQIHPSYYTHQLEQRTVYLPCQDRSLQQLLRLPMHLWRTISQPHLLRTVNVFRYGFAALRLRAFYAFSDLTRERFDVIHCHYGHVGRAFIPMRDILNVPFVTSFHGDDLSRFGRADRLLYRPLFALCDAVVANSEFTRSSVLRLGCPSGKVWKIPSLPGLDADEIGARKPRGSIRTVLTVARLDEAKGIQFCLDAVHAMVNHGKDINYVIVGEGPFRCALEAKVSALGLRSRVRFTGGLATPEVRREYEAADVFVLPSICLGKRVAPESQGVVIQEAQGFGLPVIGSNIGGIPESLDYGRAGILVPAGDPIALSKALEDMVNDQAEAGRIGGAGAAYCRTRYNSTAIMDQLIGLYERVLPLRSSRVVLDAKPLPTR